MPIIVFLLMTCDIVLELIRIYLNLRLEFAFNSEYEVKNNLGGISDYVAFEGFKTIEKGFNYIINVVISSVSIREDYDELK